jgi:hypothetical protein
MRKKNQVQTYLIVVSTSPPELDSPYGGGPYNAGTSITIGVDTVSGYTFQQWNRDGLYYGDSMNFQYTVDASHTFTAVFQPITTIVTTGSSTQTSTAVSFTISTSTSSTAATVATTETIATQTPEFQSTSLLIVLLILAISIFGRRRRHSRRCASKDENRESIKWHYGSTRPSCTAPDDPRSMTAHANLQAFRGMILAGIATLW